LGDGSLRGKPHLHCPRSLQVLTTEPERGQFSWVIDA
jgi:hypothetical protein